MQQHFRYDLLVIGMGSGGLSAGLTLHTLGLRVCFFERHAHNIGGECLNNGCVPSKALIHVSRQIHQARQAKTYGLEAGGQVDWPAVKAYVRGAQDIIRDRENVDYFRSRNIDVVIGEARFVDKNTIICAGNRYTAPKIVLAAGSSPARLDVPGADRVPYYDNENIFDLPFLPKRLLVAGGGPIGLELGQAFQRLGAAVTIVHRGERILEKEDPEVSKIITDRLTREGITLHLEAEVASFPSANTAEIKFKNHKTALALPFDAVLVGIGRKVRTESLGLPAAGIEVKEGKIVVNDYLQTTNSSVFVCGDSTGGPYFSHAAERQAPVLVNNLLSPFKKKISYTTFSWVTFTDPEIATFGQTAAQLQQSNTTFHRIEHDFTHDDRAAIDQYRYGKLILFTTPPKAGLPGNSRILGGTLVAPRAGDMAQELVLAMEQKLKLSAIFQKTYAYPVATRVHKSAVVNSQEKALKPWMKRLLRWWYKAFH